MAQLRAPPRLGTVGQGVSRVRPVSALADLQRTLARAGFERTVDEIAAGFVEVANASMTQAIQQVSVARGVDPRDYALVGFGGAGGQHVCAIARGPRPGPRRTSPEGGIRWRVHWAPGSLVRSGYPRGGEGVSGQRCSTS